MTDKIQPMLYEELNSNPTLAEHTYANNFLSDVAELETKMESENDLSFHPVYTTLRFSSHDEHLYGKDYCIGVKKAYLIVEPSGYNVQQSNRYGEVNIGIMELEIEETATKSRNDGSNANLGIGPSSTTLSASKGSDREARHSAKKTYKTQSSSVKPQTKNRWTITPREGEKKLEGLFLDGVTLCNLQKKTGANAHSVTVSLLIRKTDFSFTQSNSSSMFRFAREINNEKLLGLFTGKVMSQKSSRESEVSEDASFILASQSLMGSEI